LGYAMYPPGNVIAVAEKKEKCVPGVPSLFKAQQLVARSYFCIHFLNLRDGSPYCTPPSNAIVCELPPRAGPIIGNRIVITGSRVMMYVYYYDEDPLGDAMVRKILVWDWKTGELVRFCGLNNFILLSPLHQVLDLLFTNRTEPVKQNPRAIFLDEFRMALVDRWGIAELAVFNTLVPQGSSGNLRRFGFPPEFRDRHGKIFADCDRDLGTPNRGDAFVPDPTQAVLAVELGRCSEPHLLLVVRTQVLIERIWCAQVLAFARMSGGKMPWLWKFRRTVLYYPLLFMAPKW